MSFNYKNACSPEQLKIIEEFDKAAREQAEKDRAFWKSYMARGKRANG